MNYVDLHVHSKHSDGTNTPAELVELAIQSNLSVIALTDHDTVSGVPEIMELAKENINKKVNKKENKLWKWIKGNQFISYIILFTIMFSIINIVLIMNFFKILSNF